MSELQRVAVVSPVMLFLIAGLHFLPFLSWLDGLIVLLPVTFAAIVCLQLALKFVPALPADLRRGRVYNRVSCVAIAALGLLPWYL